MIDLRFQGRQTGAESGRHGEDGAYPRIAIEIPAVTIEGSPKRRVGLGQRLGFGAHVGMGRCNAHLVGFGQLQNAQQMLDRGDAAGEELKLI